MVSLAVAVGAYIAICIAVIAVLVLGPNRDQRDGVLGKAYRFVSKVPGLIGVTCCLAFACCNVPKAERKWASCEERSFYRKNPALLIFYMALVWTVEGLYLWFVAPTLPTLHCAFGFAMVFVAEYYFFRAWWCDPGVMTPRELSEMEVEERREERRQLRRQNGDDAASSDDDDGDDVEKKNKKDAAKKKQKPTKTSALIPAEELKQNCRYDFDGFLYACAYGNGYGDSSRGAECYTCNVPRPSRSKHCSMCGHCVRRFDHHCPWINNDVGEGSLRFFIYFVFWHVIACFKGAYDCVWDCMRFVEEKRVWKSYFVNNAGQRSEPTWGIVLMYLLQHKIVIGCVALFAALVGCMLLWFLYHHVRMMLKNVTTNDETKIDTIIEYVELLHNYAVNREELNKMQARARDGHPNALSGDILEEREGRLANTLANMEAYPPSFMDKRAAARLRQEIFAMPLGGPAVPAKEHRRRRAEATKLFKKELYKTFSLGSAWANFKDSMWPYGTRPKPAEKVRIPVPGAVMGKPTEAAAAPQTKSASKKRK